MSAEVPEPLHDPVGGHLIAVTFFVDYQRIALDGPGDGEEQSLEVYARSSLRHHGHKLMSGEPGYRDALCDQLGAKVQRAKAEAKDIVIEFDTEVALVISLCPEDAAGPEAAYYVRLSKEAVVSRMVW